MRTLPRHGWWRPVTVFVANRIVPFAEPAVPVGPGGPTSREVPAAMHAALELCMAAEAICVARKQRDLVNGVTAFDYNHAHWSTMRSNG